MAALCVCCDESKSKFYTFTSKKCALYEIESIIKSLMKDSISYLDLNPLKRKNICANCVKTLSQISRIRENISKALNVTKSANSQPTTPVESGKRSAKTPPSQLRSGQTKKRILVVDQLLK